MWFGISAAVGNTIAAGIVRAPGDIAQWLPNVYLFFGVWVIGGLYALSGASSMAELGAAIPRSGGQYNFSRRALGEYAGFIVGSRSSSANTAANSFHCSAATLSSSPFSSSWDFSFCSGAALSGAAARNWSPRQ
jgi:APA family basic amino acid/polyamine antiporter